MADHSAAGYFSWRASRRKPDGRCRLHLVERWRDPSPCFSCPVGGNGAAPRVCRAEGRRTSDTIARAIRNPHGGGSGHCADGRRLIHFNSSLKRMHRPVRVRRIGLHETYEDSHESVQVRGRPDHLSYIGPQKPIYHFCRPGGCVENWSPLEVKVQILFALFFTIIVLIAQWGDDRFPLWDMQFANLTPQ
jgi:hypothetical protein